MRVERLGPHHNIEHFTCGVKALDDWLRDHALENQRRDLSRVFVLLDDASAVVGYYSLTMGGVSRESLPRRIGRGLPGIEIGMVLLGRLAIATAAQGAGLGRDLLIEALDRAVIAGEHAAARFVAVDPIDESARQFYEKFGFRAVPDDPGGRMYVRLDEALDALRR